MFNALVSLVQAQWLFGAWLDGLMVGWIGISPTMAHFVIKSPVGPPTPSRLGIRASALSELNCRLSPPQMRLSIKMLLCPFSELKKIPHGRANSLLFSGWRAFSGSALFRVSNNRSMCPFAVINAESINDPLINERCFD